MPPGIVKRAAQVPQPFALFLLLDGIPYCEIAERRRSDFESALVSWRRVNLPTLVRSQVRYFVRHKDLALTEVRP
jgi:hypothetical protein